MVASGASIGVDGEQSSRGHRDNTALETTSRASEQSAGVEIRAEAAVAILVDSQEALS